jgi:hypothetical protein
MNINFYAIVVESSAWDLTASLKILQTFLDCVIGCKLAPAYTVIH